MKKITIENTQAKATWATVEVNRPENYNELIAGLEPKDIDFVNDVLFGIATKKSNYDVTLRARIKDIASAQTVADNYFTTVNIEERASEDAEKVAEKIAAAEKLAAETSPELMAAIAEIKAAQALQAAKKAEKRAKAKAKKESAKKTV